MKLDEFITLAVLLLLAAAAQAEAVKVDCHPVGGATKERCESLGCIWSPVKSSGIANYQSLAGFEATEIPGQVQKSRVDEPWCYFPSSYYGYQVLKRYNATEIKIGRIRPSVFGKDDVANLIVRLTDLGQALRIQVIDADRQRFEPELPQVNVNAFNAAQGIGGPPKSQFKIDLRKSTESDRPGELIITRETNGQLVFTVDLDTLIYSDRFIQLNSRLSSPYLFGLGEHYDTFLKLADRYKTYSFYNTDRLTLPDGTRSYGGFPFFVNLDSHNYSQAHGVYLRSSNGMDIVLQNDLSVTFRPIGGILDFFIFTGPTPLDVVSQYQKLVGLPELPPRWSLGFHLCRFKYGSLERTREIWHRTRAAGIPFDVQWNDADYMDKYNDFTLDRVKYAGLSKFVDELHEANMHYMMLFDPGLSQESNYQPYELGQQMDVFIKNATNQTLVGRVWNLSNRTVWPDFSNPRSHDFWTELFVKFHQEVAFDGAWIDMNDISNFVDGSLDGCPDEPSERPPYLPGGYPLQTRSLCLSAKHRGGSEYNLHNLYSFYEAIATKKALAAARPGKRSLIIARSSHPGQGRYSGHWNGDVLSNWAYLKWTIPSLLEHSMYGFTMMGSDICGFLGPTTVPLCARWSTLGAFYTFSRNHNDDISIDQDPVALGPVVVAANKKAFTKRYSLLPYLYTLMHEASERGRPVARSMAFEFFEQFDREALRAEDQFMWGSGVLIAPIVEEHSTSKRTYLPKGRWYELDLRPEFGSSDADEVLVPSVVNSRMGQQWHETQNVDLDNLVLFYRGGNIIPFYPKVRQTIPETVAQPMGLEVALCEMERARGTLVLDDGDTTDSMAISKLKMKVERNRTLEIHMLRDNYQTQIEFGLVKVYGLTIKVGHVRVLSPEAASLPFQQKEHMLMFDLAGTKVAKDRPIKVQWS